MNAPPSSSPPGGPAGDAIVITGPTGSVTVVYSAALGSKATRIERGHKLPPAVSLRLLPAGAPLTNGSFVVTFAGANEIVDQAPLTLAVTSSSGKRLLELVQVNGAFDLTTPSGLSRLPLAYAASQEQTFRLSIDLDRGEYSASVRCGQYSYLVGPTPFLDSGANDLAEVSLTYPVPLVEATPGLFYIDDVTIRRSRLAS